MLCCLAALMQRCVAIPNSEITIILFKIHTNFDGTCWIFARAGAFLGFFLSCICSFYFSAMTKTPL